MKLQYDQRHQAIDLKVADLVYLRLNRRYRLPEHPNPILSNQRCGPFRVKARIGKLAYKLELPLQWQISNNLYRPTGTSKRR